MRIYVCIYIYTDIDACACMYTHACLHALMRPRGCKCLFRLSWMHLYMCAQAWTCDIYTWLLCGDGCLRRSACHGSGIALYRSQASQTSSSRSQVALLNILMSTEVHGLFGHLSAALLCITILAQHLLYHCTCY